jgi:SAM-dependent methyltransferase
MLSITKESRGHHFGNFHNYYDFHETLSRMSVMFEGSMLKMWQSMNCPDVFSILDVGCNEGNLTAEILRIAREQLPESVVVIAVGIDIDEDLINRAKTKYGDTGMQFFSVNCMESAEYASFIHAVNIETFSVVCAFSITMWIHMNFGDAGLMDFLTILGSTSANSIIVEPQKWISYRKAIQRCRRLKIPELPYYKNITIRNIEEACVKLYHENFAMKLVCRNQCEEWGRELLIFCKFDIDNV